MILLLEISLITLPGEILAITHRDSGYGSGLVTLGKIDSGIEAFKVPGSVRVRIELIE